MSQNQSDKEIQNFMSGVIKRNPHETEFHQAVEEVATSVMPFLMDNKKYKDAYILERMTEPDRVIMFRVSWMDDQGKIRANRAWRVQFNNSIGPYKGGMRFHPTVNTSVLKFLGFEQTFKNALTGLPMGGAKGGSNFNPKGKSDNEVMRFCHSLMVELHRHIGEDVDVPAGDIGVGAREISYLFGHYKRLANRWAGVFTGKGLPYGGSLGRTEATGYGSVFFMDHMLHNIGDGLEGKKASISGSGNVAIYTIEKLLTLGATPITASDSGGSIYDEDGITREKLEWLKDLKEVRRGRIKEYAEHFGCEYFEKQTPWHIPTDIAFPSATQNEIDEKDALTLVKNGCIGVSEGANMPTTPEAISVLHENKILFAPGKAANAGGVSVSGLEQSQNALRISWSKGEVETKLQGIMKSIHNQCCEYGTTEDKGYVDYVKGANLAGFKKVADAMLAFGVV